MSHFLTTVDNSRGTTVKASGNKDGQSAHIRGWNLGVRVHAHLNEDGKDVFDIYMTSGSNDTEKERLVGTATMTWENREFIGAPS